MEFISRFSFRLTKGTQYSIASIFSLLFLWFILSATGTVSTSVLPSPKMIGQTFSDFLTKGYSGRSAWEHISASLIRTMTGLVTGIVLGVPLGLLMGYFYRLNAFLGTIFSLIRPVPPIAFIPLVILYFGIGEFSKIVLIATAAFWYIVLNTTSGARSTPKILVQAARNLGLSNWQMFKDVILPAAMPFVFTGIRTATAISWAIVVAAELVAAQTGLGYIIMDASTFFNIPMVYVGIILIGVIGLILELVVVAIERRTLHWHGK